MGKFTLASLLSTIVLFGLSAAAVGPIENPRAVLNSHVEDLPVSNKAKNQIYGELGVADGFGIRLSEILLLKPDVTSDEWVVYLASKNLSFGMSSAQIREYSEFGYYRNERFESRAEENAYDRLTPKTKEFLRRLGDPNAKGLAERFSEQTLIILGATPAAFEQINDYVQSQGYRLARKARQARPPNGVRFRRFEQFAAMLNQRSESLVLWPSTCMGMLE